MANLPKKKEFNAGDKVALQTADKEWIGNILESYDPEIILLKLESGYNIGIRESKILKAKVLKKYEEKEEPQEKKSSPNQKLRNIALIITGGTISSRLDPKTGGVISTDAKEILNIAPEIKEIANIVKVENPFMKFSEDMEFKDWKILAEKTSELLNDENIDGIIISHGTDFLHYTSAALSFYLQELNKPVALTYSQRSIDRGSTDAHINLICSAKYAVSDIAEVAIVGHADLNDEKCFAMPGTKVRKMHTSRRDTFKTINDTPIAEIPLNNKEKIKYLKEFNARDSDKKSKVKLDAKYSDKIALIKIHPSQNPDILEFYAKKGCKGIILELSGLGQAPGKNSRYNWLPTIKKLTQKGITICGTAQTLYGSLNPNVYSAGRELQKTGLIFLKDILPETALIKLSWVLGHKTWTKNKETIKEKMLQNFTGEFNEELGLEF